MFSENGLVFSFAVLIITLVLWLLRVKSQKCLNLPPGPRGIPLLGYLPFLGKDLHITFSQLATKYGSVVGLYIGTQYCVVLNDFQEIKEACTKDDFLDRPPGYFQISTKYKHLIELTGDEWRDHRKFQLSTFNTLGMTKAQLEYSTLKEINELVTMISNSESDEVVDLSGALSRRFDHIIFHMLYGKPFPEEHPYLKSAPAMTHALSMLYRIEEDAIFKPWINWLLPLWPLKFREYKRTLNLFGNIIAQEIQGHQQNLDENNPADFIDHFLLEMKNRTDPTTDGFTENNLVGNMLMLIGAGSVTSSTTVAWLFMQLARHPEVQEKCYREICENFGSAQEIMKEDNYRLPYLQATIAESQRLCPISYLNLLRKCNSSKAKIANFDIPHGTIIIQNMWHLNFNETLWKDPQTFKPERFLREDNTKLQIPEYLIPFSCGKRKCPGSKVATTVIFIFAANMIRHFRILPPESGVSMEVWTKFNVTPAKPFVRFELRKCAD